MKGVYILGAGNLGVFVAHSLAGIPSRPPITLLLRRRQFQYYLERDSSLDVTTRGITETRRGFEVEVLLPPSQLFREQEEPSQSMDPNASDRERSEGSPPQSDRLSNSESGPQQDDHSQATAAEQVSPDDYRPSAVGASLPYEHLDVTNTEVNGSDRKPDTEKQEVVNRWFAQAEYEERQSRFENEKNTHDAESGGDPRQSDDIIFSLIVSVKAPQIVRALQSVAHRLTRESTILFLQNGMGILDEVNEKLFPDEESRPTYVVGVVSHGLYSTRNFSVIHAGEGTIALGVMPRLPMAEREQPEQLSQLAPSARYLLRTMTRTPIFVAVGFPPTDLLQQQLDKLAVNCIINPLTALMDCKNGALLSNFSFTRVMRLLLAEIALVIKSLPELKNVPNVKMRFDTARLEGLVYSIANSTANNNSSMLQDLRQGKQTEIDYINGYVIKRGEEMGVHCVINYMLVHMIKGKRKIAQEQADLLPFAGSGRDR